MSTTFQAISDSLPSDIPKLASNGVNWAIFELRFSAAVKAKGRWGHFDGTAAKPSPPPPADGEAATLTPAEDAITTSPPDASGTATVSDATREKWDKDEATAKNLLLQKIPDSVAMKICRHATVALAWASIVEEFMQRSVFAQTELRTTFLDSKCPEKGDVRKFLDDLRAKREDLASLDVEIDDKDYRSTIISSLPPHLANFASMQLTAAKLYSSSRTIEPDLFIQVIADEWDRFRLQSQRSRRGLAKPTAEGDDEALALSPERKP
jgi:gag-polypeptide of LTR copia-type